MDRVIRQLRIDELKRQLHYEKFCEDSKKSGTVVAVLDSGMCPSHMDLYGKAIAFYDFVNRRKNLYDDYGHGTHICGCIAGSGKASNNIICTFQSFNLCFELNNFSLICCITFSFFCC